MSAAICPTCNKLLPLAVTYSATAQVVRCDGCSSLLLWSAGRVIRAIRPSEKTPPTPPVAALFPARSARPPTPPHARKVSSPGFAATPSPSLAAGGLPSLAGPATAPALEPASLPMPPTPPPTDEPLAAATFLGALAATEEAEGDSLHDNVAAWGDKLEELAEGAPTRVEGQPGERPAPSEDRAPELSTATPPLVDAAVLAQPAASREAVLEVPSTPAAVAATANFSVGARSAKPALPVPHFSSEGRRPTPEVPDVVTTARISRDRSRKASGELVTDPAERGVETREARRERLEPSVSVDGKPGASNGQAGARRVLGVLLAVGAAAVAVGGGYFLLNRNLTPPGSDVRPSSATLAQGEHLLVPPAVGSAAARVEVPGSGDTARRPTNPSAIAGAAPGAGASARTTVPAAPSTAVDAAHPHGSGAVTSPPAIAGTTTPAATEKTKPLTWAQIDRAAKRQVAIDRAMRRQRVQAAKKQAAADRSARVRSAKMAKRQAALDRMKAAKAATRPPPAPAGSAPSVTIAKPRKISKAEKRKALKQAKVTRSMAAKRKRASKGTGGAPSATSTQGAATGASSQRPASRVTPAGQLLSPTPRQPRTVKAKNAGRHRPAPKRPWRVGEASPKAGGAGAFGHVDRAHARQTSSLEAGRAGHKKRVLPARVRKGKGKGKGKAKRASKAAGARAIRANAKRLAEMPPAEAAGTTIFLTDDPAPAEEASEGKSSSPEAGAGTIEEGAGATVIIPSAPAGPASPSPAVARQAMGAPSVEGVERVVGADVVEGIEKASGAVPATAPVVAAPALIFANAADPSTQIVEKARVAYRRAGVMLFSGELAIAEQQYRQALVEYPGYVAAYRGLGIVYERRGKDSEAIEAWSTYLKLVPAAKDAWRIRRQLERAQQKPAQPRPPR